MKIEIILPDGAIAGVLNYFAADETGGWLGNVILNDLEDGNLYTLADGDNVADLPAEAINGKAD